MTMEWSKLLSVKRLGLEGRQIHAEEARSEFQRDYDRIIFSSPFRRLQNKTQVFPLPGSIFVHNRLTHSLEVASVGRSLGTLISNQLIKEQGENPLFWELGSVVAAACLAHDLGNPPFGHSGEKAISRYFTHGAGQELKDQLTDAQWEDVTHFEGNANAFRLLTHQFQGRRAGGFALTYTTLATIVKYPCESVAGMQKGKTHRKKYGFFQSEVDSFRGIAEELGMIREQAHPLVYYRHPLVYLVEAADDICYHIVDLEDAHRLSIIGQQDTIDYLKAFYGDAPRDLDKIDETLRLVTDKNEQIAYLRARVIGKLIRECADIFWDNRAAILSGSFEGSLIDAVEGSSQKALQDIATFSVNEIYNHRSVVKIELAGYHVLGGLLEELIGAATSSGSHYAEKMLSLIPRQFRWQQDSAYGKIMSILDFVSGMTDIFAVETYRQIKGMSTSYV